MANRQPTRVCVDHATQIDLLSTLAAAKISIETAAAAVEAFHRAGALPRTTFLISQYLADAIDDLGDRVRNDLEDEGGGHAA
jgi:hypothetical protein